MTKLRKPRVMWLLNHGSARKFEVAMLKKIGIEEIFLPKKYPDDPGFRSASVDFSEDINLSLSDREIGILNSTDWYGSPSLEAWEIANRHFDVLFFILYHPEFIRSVARHYRGAVLWRVYGREIALNYSKALSVATRAQGKGYFEALGKRFWFAEAYEHLHKVEPEFLNRQHLYLPLGLHDCMLVDLWRGEDKRIFFVCPDIAWNSYYIKIYNKFVKDFAGFPYVVGGAQSIRVNSPFVLGFVSRETHERNMQQMRVMFYHSIEPNHIHYHPFEAIKAGMPLVFMAGGLLDRLGGKNLPGRCETIKEARRKIERLLNDDWGLIEAIRKSQVCLLEPMKPENCVDAWRAGFQRILDSLEKSQVASPVSARCKRRVAVIVPVDYRGGSWRGAKLLAQAIESGSRQAGQETEVVLGHLDDPVCYPEEEFADLPPSIKRRPYHWRILEREEAYRAMAYAGLERPMESATYMVPDDGIKQFMDCDLWVVVSDRLSHPLLPVRPYALMVYDYLQRYEPLLPHNLSFINAAHTAERVFVTTEFTRQDAIQFAGIPEQQVIKLPMLAPVFSSRQFVTDYKSEKQRYFLWTTNLAPHKNHENAFKALRLYYEKQNGQIECRVTGVNTKDMLKSDLPHLKPMREILAGSPTLKRQLTLLGELPDQAYQIQLAGCEFLWHAGRIDNGTFSVVEAAHLQVPALSSDYPAMHEIDAQFGLTLAWMDAHDPENMARQLKRMETEASSLRAVLPTPERLASQSVEQLAGAYWKAVRECL